MPYADVNKAREAHRRWQKNNRPILNAYGKRYRLKHPERIKSYALRHRQKILAARPPKPPCTVCGLSDRVVWSKRRWACFGCREKVKNANKLERNRRYVKKQRCKIISEKYGVKAGNTYLEHALNHHHSGIYGPKKIHTLCLPRDYQKLSSQRLDRLYKLNRILKLPFGNIGWTCQICKTYSAEGRFFDIDHIHPRHKGGHGRIDNLQVLCPNCHRRKTCADVWDDFLAQSELQSAASRSNPCTTGSLLPLQEQNTTATEYRPVVNSAPPTPLVTHCTDSA